MVTTRQAQQATLLRVLHDILGLEDDSPLHKACVHDGMTSMEDLLALSPIEIEDLTYLEGSTKTLITKGHRGLVFALQALSHQRDRDNNRIPSDWSNVDMLEFDTFRSGPDYRSSRNGVSLPTNTSSSVSPPILKARDPLSDFRRGVRRDPGSYIQLKEDKQWDSWQRSTIAQARAQDLSDVLDPAFIPPTGAESELFAEKQKFVYAVFEKVLMTDKGKALVRNHSSNFDAQKIYADLCSYSQSSTGATMEASNLLTYITSTRYGDGSWKGTAHGYILHWQDQIRKYEQIIPISDHFSTSIKRAMLENAVGQYPELRAVKTQAAQFKTQNGRDLTYEEYCSLLMSAAQEYDGSLVRNIKNNPSAARRSVYNSDISSTLDEDSPFDVHHDIDSYCSDVLEVNFNAFRGASLNADQWGRLSTEAKAKWDEIDRDMKAIILEHKLRPPAGAPARPARRDFGKPNGSRFTPKPRPDDTAINLHDMSAVEYLVAFHNMAVDGPVTDDGVTAVVPPEPDPPSSQLFAHMTKKKDIPPGDIQRVLSQSMAKGFPPPARKSIVIDGVVYSANVHIQYRASSHRHVRAGALVDRGANGGIAGDDVRIINRTGRQVDVQGIDNHQIIDIPIVTAGAVIKTQRGDVIAILHQYAYTGKGKTIHSSGQLEWHKQYVDDKSIKVGGKQHIRTLDGYIIPLDIKSGLPYVPMRPFTDAEWDALPHVILTGDADWNPSVLDHSLVDDDTWYDTVPDLPDALGGNPFDAEGNYRDIHVFDLFITDSILDDTVITDLPWLYQAHARQIQDRQLDFANLRPHFGWLPADIVQRTFACTTQYARMPMSTVLKKHYKSPFPALNVHRRDEALATDTVYSDVPAIDSGVTIAQLFVGLTSTVCDVYPLKSEKAFVNTLQDIIRRRGAPSKLVSDRAQVEISGRVKDILRNLIIGDWQSEPHQQHQNPAERKYQDVKRMANTLMDRTGSPPHTWLLALTYVCFVLNFTASASLNWRTPIEVLTGSTPDISPLLSFAWWDPVYYKLDDGSFPSDSRERRGHFVGISEHVGHAMTYMILTDDTHKVIHRSNVRTALDPTSANKRVDPPSGEKPQPPPIIQSRSKESDEVLDDNGEPQTRYYQLPLVDTSDLIGRTFLTEQEDGQKHRARIVAAIEEHGNNVEKNPGRMKFVCSVNDDKYEEIMTYNEIMNHIEQSEEDAIVWKFKRIIGHEGPLSNTHAMWKGSTYNVRIEWENGEITDEPMTTIAADDPVTCAIYAKDNALLDVPGWKRFKSIAKRQQHMFRMANQAKLRSFRLSPKYKYGFEIPRDYKHAIELDAKSGTTRWSDATHLEMAQLDEYDCFQDQGTGAIVPKGFKKIRVHLIYDIKHDGRHKARLVADGHLTDIPVDSVYSGVVTLRGLRLLIFLAELNGLCTWATDIGNAYLEAVTSERVCIIAGPEFGARQGHLLIIHKALYGLRSSGARWHDRFSDCLRAEGFLPCKAEPDIWLRPNNGVYEYIGVYVDDLAIAMAEPQAFVNILEQKHGFKLKGTGEISFHLGCDFFRDEEGVLCMAPRKYIEKMMMSYETMFGEKPSTKIHSPLEKGDHPELDTSELLDQNGVQQYQSLIGSLQWAISLGRFDVATAVMSLSSFRALPRRGHLDRAKRICGYLYRMKHAVIRFRIHEPDYSDLPDPEHDWDASVYGHVVEELPYKAPDPLGKPVVLTHYVDANLYHNVLTGRSVTGILHLINGTPIDWYSKKQATVETATYGSEFVAARTCVEQIIDLRQTLRYLGVPVLQKSYMFGDNKTVVDSATKIHAKLHKRHTALSFHRVREAMAAGFIAFNHIAGVRNPADVLSKHWSYACVWNLLQPLLFWMGDTANIVVPV